MKRYPLILLLLAGLSLCLEGCVTTQPEPEEAFVVEMQTTREPANVSPETTPQAKPMPDPAQIVFLPQPRLINFPEGSIIAPDAAPVTAIDPQAMPHPQGYTLDIANGRVSITGGDKAGLFYGQKTLDQLKHQYAGTGRLPLVHIEDWPDFPNRGVMLDIARDKVPSMETLYQYVDLFVSLKFNQIQLYTEHTFAYPGHEVVWKDASPMTAEEIRALDKYCAERFMELVPNQNSFGHMHRWLQHDAYKSLGETPGSPDLCPTNPGSIALLRSMYDSLLPNFTSAQVNVGCDETFTLGKGGSKEAVDKLGKGRVYLNFLTQIYELAQSHGKTMQFWGDIILEYPELIPELPKNIIAMEWGYEANHPFAERGAKFARSGVPFYVCPGSSSWNSLLGRTDNALENLRLAARNGLDNGAIGYLITDWGDSGHWQFAPVSFVPFAWGAALCWAYDANLSLDLAKAVDTHVFRDSAGVMSRAAMDLGNAHALTGVIRGNNSVYYGLLLNALQGDPKKGFLAGMTTEGIDKAAAQIRNALDRMSQADMDRPDADLILKEFQLNARMALFALDLGKARLKEGCGTAQLPEKMRARFTGEIDQILAAYKDLWLARNRPGGLSDSMDKLGQIRTLLNQ